MQKPDNYSLAGCNHPDVTFAQLHEFCQGCADHYKANLEHLLDAQSPNQHDTPLDTSLPDFVNKLSLVDCANA